MKKITLLLLLFITKMTYSQITYYRFETYSTQEKACAQDVVDRFVVKVNIEHPNQLNLGSYYYLDLGSNFGLGKRYCKVTNLSEGSGDADFDLNHPSVSNSLNSHTICNMKYYYFNLSTYSSYQSLRENRSSDRFNMKVHIKLPSNIFQYHTSVGSVMKVDFGNEFNLGSRYCVINNKSESLGDSDADLDYAENNVNVFVYEKTYNYHNIITFTSKQKAVDYLCHGSRSHDGTYKVNLYTADLHLTNKVYTANFGNNFNLGTRYFVVSNNYWGRGDADFDINTSVTAIGNCSTLSNPNTGGEPDLVLKQIKIGYRDQFNNLITDNFGEVKYTYSDNANKPLKLLKDTNHDICVTIQNKGNANAGNSKLDVLISPTTSIYDAWTTIKANQSYGAINSNGTQEKCFSYRYDSNFGVIGSHTRLNTSKTYYFFVHVDKNNSVAENAQGEQNNDVSESFKYITSSGNLYSRGFHFPKLIFNFNDFSRVIVNDKEEESSTVQKLKNNTIYIIQDNQGNSQKIIKK
ncbi:CARDB domain-containing protein [Tenacibaculum xiamenense]|uniref:CARDB domain-containing protein n=1 Tax=Tenacibaculum xiamenense TaxID=1261553 RepID=UPI003892F324